jgi:DMSO/TMAO reductase YedYZ molybdopterin-dependent catalytic subunit
LSRLDFITSDPPNAGTPVDLLDGRILAAEDVYMRNNFAIPPSAPDQIGVRLPGRDFILTVDEMRRMPQSELTMILECAGNGRILMDPVPDGTPWDLGGASPVRFGGVRLLEAVGPVPEDVSELVFTGADSGEVAVGEHVNYQFSLERDAWEDSILALRLGDLMLPHDHGGPIRLVVPGHYAMKSVKWLTSIEAAPDPFRGHFVEKYRYFSDDTEPEGAPVREVQVRSVIARPAAGEAMTGSQFEVVGAAWSGSGPVVAVEVSLDDGVTWLASDLEPVSSPYAAVRWSLRLELPAGSHTLVSRATDHAGNTQPLNPRWNRNGYANNVVHRVEIDVSGQQAAN